MAGKGPALCPARSGEHAMSEPSSSIQETGTEREEEGLGLQEPFFPAPSHRVGGQAGVPTSCSEDQDTEPSDGETCTRASGTKP